MNRSIFLVVLTIICGLNSAVKAQPGYAKIADETIGYLKAGTFGKPDVAKKTNKLALTQVRIHYKLATTRAAETRDNGAKVTVYLDGEMTHNDLQKLTDEFYASLQRKLGALGIEFVDWNAIAATEYFNNREEATAEKNNINSDAGNGQAWVSYTANKGPVFYRYSVDQTKMFGNELLAYSKIKKITEMAESLGADFATLDAVVDFTSIVLATEKGSEWREDGHYLTYNANYSIAPLMSVPQSYSLFVNHKGGFDQYSSRLPIGQRDFFAEKPYENQSKAALKTKTFFGDTRFTFTPVVITAKRDLYIAAARRALELYADMFVEKMRLIRSGEKPSDKNVAQKPVDNTTMKQVKEEARKNNDTTPITTDELTAAAQQAQKEGKFKLAVDYYGELIKQNPDEFNYYLQRGVILLNDLKENKAAMKDFDKSIQLNPSEPLLFYNRGSAYLQMYEFKKAKKDFDSILSLKPDYVDAYLNRGIVFLNLKDYDGAMTDLNTGIRMNPRYPNLYKARALVYKMQGNAALAQADELRAAQLERGQ